MNHWRLQQDCPNCKEYNKFRNLQGRIHNALWKTTSYCLIRGVLEAYIIDIPQLGYTRPRQVASCELPSGYVRCRSPHNLNDVVILSQIRERFIGIAVPCCYFKETKFLISSADFRYLCQDKPSSGLLFIFESLSEYLDHRSCFKDGTNRFLSQNTLNQEVVGCTQHVGYFLP